MTTACEWNGAPPLLAGWFSDAPVTGVVEDLNKPHDTGADVDALYPTRAPRPTGAMSDPQAAPAGEVTPASASGDEVGAGVTASTT